MSSTPKARKASNSINAAVTTALQRDGYTGQTHQVGSDPELPLDTNAVPFTGESIQAGTESTSPSAEPTRGESPEPANLVENEAEVQASSQDSLFSTKSEHARGKERALEELNVSEPEPVTPPRRGASLRDEPGSSSEASNTPTPSGFRSEPAKSKGKGRAVSDTDSPSKRKTLVSAGPRGNQANSNSHNKISFPRPGSPRSPNPKSLKRTASTEIDRSSGQKGSSSRVSVIDPNAPDSSLTLAKKRLKKRNASPEIDSRSWSSPAKDKAHIKLWGQQAKAEAGYGPNLDLKCGDDPEDEETPSQRPIRSSSPLRGSQDC
ncbi:hypothetical protein FRC12_011841 [Ceratobasidium sp. 428]|nr:hypothetical protein FRC12_011841 [Ceratobasidium sp. 428]